MKLSKILSSCVVTMLLGGSVFAGSETHWGYTGHEAPQNWGELSPDYSACKDGRSQSPINISKDGVVATNGLENIEFNYKTNATEVVNNGHTIQVNVKEGSSIKIDGIVFNLVQFHFHTPSENMIEGKSFPLELHLVHASKDAELAVVALMFEEGKENKILGKIWDKMPHVAGDKVTCGLPSSTMNDMLPKDKSYFRFNGSLTTPPCSEGVRWFVLKEYATISKEQVKEFFDVFGHENNRPTQPLNARKVMK
ncbi:MAG: carbonic anhydrase family protein [Sulfurimonas sp.]|uniref:carbonic anhydrase n=1 Tax=Sulfurimonas sp. TaxID=2022749 RepID=UPI002638F160|nr:carbonic anhydrase family protein [Sulfurimonas sp.]MDD3475356.1 carbonic anhydrase family protein [Sulfurimonas sp.]